MDTVRQILSASWVGLIWLAHVIKDYQSLLAGIMALCTAIYALRPVYKQLHVSQIQTAVASRELLFGRVKTISHRRRIVDAAIRSITTEFTARLYQNDPEGEPDINIEWAFGADQIVGQVIQEFERQQSGMGDRETIEDTRAQVIRSATALQQCLTAIHQYHTYDFDDPENGWSEEKSNAERARAKAASEAAERELDARIRAVAESGRGLDAAYADELKEIGVRVLQINKLVLREDHLAT
jgi:hypothetical protein